MGGIIEAAMPWVPSRMPRECIDVTAPGASLFRRAPVNAMAVNGKLWVQHRHDQDDSGCHMHVNILHSISRAVKPGTLYTSYRGTRMTGGQEVAW